MSDVANYRRLIVWQKGMGIVEEVYRVTADFPRSEVFGVTSQLRRAAISIPMNIAEGSSRGTRRDYASFVAIATGSVAELDTGLRIAVKLGFATRSQVGPILRRLDEEGRMLRVLRSRLLRPTSAGQSPSSLIPHISSP